MRGHLLLLLFVILPGCAAPVAKRPMAGDRVTPEITVVEPWPAGGLAQIMLYLQVRGEADAKPAYLQFEDVPYGSKPAGNVVFWKDDIELSRADDLVFEPDC
jgi:hypothetical protein